MSAASREALEASQARTALGQPGQDEPASG